MSLDPHASGLLTGGGFRRFKIRRYVAQGGRLKHFPDVHISDVSNIKREVPDFDPALEFAYTKRELLLLAEKILLEDDKPGHERPAYLSANRLLHRLKREIYCANGTPDPSFVSGLYWRTHPEGRKWKTQEQRKEHGSAFYR